MKVEMTLTHIDNIDVESTSVKLARYVFRRIYEWDEIIVVYDVTSKTEQRIFVKDVSTGCHMISEGEDRYVIMRMIHAEHIMPRWKIKIVCSHAEEIKRISKLLETLGDKLFNTEDEQEIAAMQFKVNNLVRRRARVDALRQVQLN